MVNSCSLLKPVVIRLKTIGLRRAGTGKHLKRLNIRFSGERMETTGNCDWFIMR